MFVWYFCPSVCFCIKVTKHIRLLFTTWALTFCYAAGHKQRTCWQAKYWRFDDIIFLSIWPSKWRFYACGTTENGAQGILHSSLSICEWVSESVRPCEHHISKTNKRNFTPFWSHMYLGSQCSLAFEIKGQRSRSQEAVTWKTRWIQYLRKYLSSFHQN